MRDVANNSNSIAPELMLACLLLACIHVCPCHAVLVRSASLAMIKQEMLNAMDNMDPRQVGLLLANASAAGQPGTVQA